MIELTHPWLLLLLPLPLLVVRFAPQAPATGAALVVPDRIGTRLIGQSQQAHSRALAWDKRLAPWIIWALIVAAVAGPRDLAPVSALKVSGRDLAIVLDLSGSMVRDDFALDGRRITRLEAVTTVGAEFARGRAGDRVALVLFGSEAYYAAPFSLDVEAVARRIEQATIGISGRATNISDGLGLALKRMALSNAKTKVVVLLSDGSNNAGATDPKGVAQLAAEMGIKVHTIALGPKDKTTAEEGERGVVDAATLRAISDLSGGESFRVRTMGDLQDVARAIDRLETNESDGLAAEIYREFWVWPAALALILCLVHIRRGDA
ncbi:MAG: VWA domain-containing protein [Pseudomonadota bacterium]